ncbi:hypothetical protein NEFER03_0330 [Nematocida sp. LUAm3]|nr:hypothetical protein NEFER03_0330 [Nematocida sp. LUAm3]KAI5173782.1 hypothetical protein NEFER02_0298 [Nematocida sp. LUAm2]KAI5177005.1 hypothetical protein NEFER01_0330 [Nematocida sp. LUAm1]
MFLQEVVKEIEKRFPLEKAEAWDNVGILLDMQREERKVLLTIDLTEEVLEECKSKNIFCVVAYHPMIFSAIKKIEDNPILHKCIIQGVSVYSPHTSMDGGELGMNRWLGVLVGGTPDRNVGNIEVFRNRMSIQHILTELKNKVALRSIRYVIGKNHNLESIPERFCTIVGSGGRVFLSEKIEGVSLLITGEASHHDLLAMKRQGLSTILLEHSTSERGFLPVLSDMLKKWITGEVYVSEADRDPVDFY